MINDLSQFLNAVNSKLQPEQVFEGHFSHEWKKEHRKWRGKCPWHNSKSGSAFYLNTETLAWRCPSCEVGGGPIQYLYQIDNGTGSPRGLEFVKIAKQLGALVGEDYPEKEYSAEQVQRFEKIEQRRSLIQCVLDSSVLKLWSADGQSARDYLHTRGLDDEQIKDLGLGLYPTPEPVLSVVTRNGGDIDQASELGILYQGSDEIFCPMTGYVVFPWNDERGHLLSLYGRWPGKPPGKQPKTKSLKNPGFDGDRWLKTKASPLFLDRAIAAKQDNVVVVEGLFDVAVLQAYGEDRAIAWVAANASAEQVTTLKRSRVKNVCFCLDPDGAGDKGTLAGIRSLENEEINTFVAPRLPEGQDPDEFVLEHGIKAWRLRLKDSIHGLRYAARAIAQRHGDKPSDQQSAEIIEAAREYTESINTENAKLHLSKFFWPEFEKLTGADSGEAAPDYDAILDEVEIIEEAEPDEARYDWALKVYAKEKDLRQYGITGEYLQTQVQSRRDRAGVLEVISTEDLMASNDKREWIIGGLIPARTVGISAADGGVGKTTWFYQMIRAIASGFDWNGLPTMKGTVLVVQVDEPRADTNEKLRDSQFHDVPVGTVNWIRRWKFTQTRQLFQIVNELKPNLVLIDSVTAAMAGTDVDMISSRAGDVIYKLRDFAEHAEWPCSFELLHHVNGSGGMRDSRSFRNNASEVRVISRPDGQSDLSKGDYLLDIQKSRAGLEGEYVLHRDDVKFNWEYHGPRNAPSNMALLREFMDERSGQKFSPSQVANGVGSTFEAAQSILEMCRRLCFIESEVKGYTDKDGNPGVFRLYWARPHMVHPEVAEAIAVSAGFTGNNENNDWEEL